MPVEKLEKPKRLDQEKLEALKELFPSVFSDGTLNFEAFKEELADNVEDLAPGDEHYGLTWPGKRQAKKLAAKPATGTLVPVPGEGVDEATTQNLIIEGDNLEVLRILQKSYAGRVKMIYIDPPYNTGNDFIYKDDFKEPVEKYLEATGQADLDGLLTSNPKASGRYHTNWLNMMLPRLRLAQTLLNDEGMIVVSISDHEVLNLKLLLNEVFGEENFIAQLVWKSRQFPDARSASKVSTDHEYILVYSKAGIGVFAGVERDEEKFNNPDNDTRGPWMSRSILGLANVEQRPNLHYEMMDPKTKNKFIPPPETGWRYSKERMQMLISGDKILFPVRPNGRPREKKFRSELKDDFISFPTIIDDVFTAQGTAEIRQIFERDIFDFPKPSNLIKRLVQQTVKESGIILDFFAGSGTTAAAVFRCNLEDSLKRNFICIQLPEPTKPNSEPHKAGFNVISAITKERIRRVSKKLKAEGATGDLGFRVLKLERSNLSRWRSYEGTDPNELAGLFAQTESALVPGWKRENVLTEIMLVEGYPLDSKQAQNPDFVPNLVTTVTHPDMGTNLHICLDATLFDTTIEAVTNYKDDVFICLETALTDEVKIRLADQINIKTL